MRHKYISTGNMEYYWFNNFHIRMQEMPEGQPSDLGDYAFIGSSQTFYTKKDFSELKERGELVAITEAEFWKAFKRATLILERLASSVRPAEVKDGIILSKSKGRRRLQVRFKYAKNLFGEYSDGWIEEIMEFVEWTNFNTNSAYVRGIALSKIWGGINWRGHDIIIEDIYEV